MTKPNTSCTIELPASLRSDGVRVHPGMPFGFPPEYAFSFAGIPNYLFTRNAPGVAWKAKPNWYIVANKDRTVQPDLQRFLAKRMGATTHAVDSSHVPMLSHPAFVIDVIRAAAKAVQASSATA